MDCNFSVNLPITDIPFLSISALVDLIKSLLKQISIFFEIYFKICFIFLIKHDKIDVGDHQYE